MKDTLFDVPCCKNCAYAAALYRQYVYCCSLFGRLVWCCEVCPKYVKSHEKDGESK